MAFKHSILTGLLLATTGVSARAVNRQAQGCPAFTNGTFNVEQYQLYPENADWDVHNCLVYFGALFNSSVVAYDPYKNEVVDIITFEGITHNPALHIGGVGVDPYTKLLTVVVDAAAPFATGGQDVSGDNFIIKYDPAKKEVLWNLNITAVSQGKYGGFQDVEHDSRGNTYIVGTYPGTILRVDPKGKAVVPWYLPTEIVSTKRGFSGLAATGDILLANDYVTNDGGPQIYRFDTTAEKGTPVLVPRTPNTTLSGSDAIYLPPKYEGKVLLVAENSRGVTVLRSKDGTWASAEHLGLIPNNSPAAQGALLVAAIQIGQSIFMVEEFFADPLVPGTTAGNRTTFPLVDITAEVTALLNV